MARLIYNCEEETEILKDFQNSVIDVCDDEKILLRFLRARNHDIRKAEEMLRKYFKWRIENKVDTCSSWTIPDLVQKTFWYLFPGLDNDGRQVVYLPVGSWQTRKFIEDGWIEDLKRDVFVVIEEIVRRVEKTESDQFYCIIDMEGSTYHKVAHYETIQLILSVFRTYEANYPERLFRAVVINAPWVFSYIFPIIKPLISKQTMDKLRVFSKQPLRWRTALLDDIPLSSLPYTLLDCKNA